ncbi:uncharacterized protein N7483_007860 [Penicillium malachiteum]|uniref:uncharacterized protein n=1 Tax=Penicillium malachiteum TaxID=1324776 RepID=UPI0025483B57|nr:uncharacterized protein N7483_007860 [Penicillium malachiteum]KAJ5726503.1 hypothetical protein N7483_007860 [Penicillium malachiteum]
MSSSGISGSKLQDRIATQGFHSIVPYDRCVRLHKTCVRGGGKVKCVMSSTPSYSEAEWRKLVKMQADIAEQRRAALEASQEAMARLMRLDRHEALLRERAGDFIAHFAIPRPAAPS